jgi:potassium efflux system protein
LLRYFACLVAVVAMAAAAPTRSQTPPVNPAPIAKAQPAQAPLAKAPEPALAAPSPSLAPLTGALDKAGAAIKDIETSLERHNHSDSELAALRQQIGPISDSVGNTIEHLAPRLDEIKARLDQLGPPPDDKAPPENPTVTGERTAQQQSFSNADELLKRAKLLSVRTEQLRNGIAARRRALFARSLFQRSASIANASLWTDIWKETPGNIKDVGELLRDWTVRIDSQLEGWRLPAFWVGLAAIFLGYIPLARLARGVFARKDAVEKPSRFRKILGAWWIALLVAVPPTALAYIVILGLDASNMTSVRMQSVLQALAAGVLRIAVVSGLARGLLAPTRPNWRLPRISDDAASALTSVVVSVACIVSATRVCEALNEVVDASLSSSVATRGLGAMISAIALSVGLWRIGAAAEDDCLGPQVDARWNWFGLVRIVAWIATVVLAAAALIGYPTFASFLLDQFIWDSAVSCVFFMATILIDESISVGFKPETRFGRWLISGVGLQRHSLDLLGVLLSGVVRLTLFCVALFMLLAPWGVQSADVPFDFREAFFGFKVGDVLISPFSIVIAAVIFGIASAAVHALQRWLDSSLLPYTALDAGLRNSIKTSLGYVGFLTAAGLALGYLGLSFEKLAIVAGALSVGIGFGLQSIVNNFVSGLILLWERAVRVGDWIVVGGDQGFVRRINVRSTEIETIDRAQVIIPNSSLVTGVVKNLVRNDRTGRLVIPVTVAGSADPDKVREVLFALAKAHQSVLKMPAPQILFTEMSGSALTFELAAFVSEVETLARIRSDLHFAIFKRFKEEGFFNGPASDPMKVQIAGMEYLDNLRRMAADEPKEKSRSTAANG